MILPPACLLFVVVASNLLNFFDRGIIPGASSEILGFIQECFPPDTSTSTTSAWYGALNSAFIASYTIASLIFGHLARSSTRPLRLVGVGLCIWCIAALVCSLAQPPPGTRGSMWHFVLLLFGRLLSGVGEGGFLCIVPGLIASSAPPARKALWLAAVYTPAPVGIALGYVGGAAAARSTLGWHGAYEIEACLMLPLALVMLFGEVPSPATSDTDKSAKLLEDDAPARKQSYWSGVKEVVSLDYLLITLGQSAQVGVLAGLAAFGPMLVLGIGFFGGNEKTASTAFGAAVAVGGAVGTPLGGCVADRMNKELDTVERRQSSLKSMVIMTTLAYAVVLCTVLTTSEIIFVALIFLTVATSYSIQASLIWSVLSCAPTELQALAMSVNALLYHVFGDVPAPIVIGFFKGKMAPHCGMEVDSAGNMSMNPLCQEDATNLRIVMAGVVSWLLVAVICWSLAWLLGRSRMQKAV